MELQEEIAYKEEHTIQNFLVKLNICKKRDWVKDLLKQDEKLAKAMKILATEGVKLLHPYNMVDRLGYDPYTRNDNKNAAMYAVAKRLGCERILAKAVPMVVVNGNQAIKGTFMENAEGNDLANLKPSDPLFYYDPKESPYHKELFRDLAHPPRPERSCRAAWGFIWRNENQSCRMTEFVTKDFQFLRKMVTMRS